jgi:DNA-directed RNA polymerase subunit RPC12/RpoP
MLTLITCPTCHHKFTIPEGAMGERHTCPNCQSLFVAGKSVAETDGRMKNLKAAMDKTMLGEVEVPIRYNCPRCKKPLESPASEAGMKKPCPACGGRLQVPTAPSQPLFDPSLNKTLLASDESAPRPVASAPYSGQTNVAVAQPPTTGAKTLSAPAVASVEPKPQPASWLGGPNRPYKIGGLIAAGVLLGLFLLGRHNANAEQERFLNAQKEELAKLKADIDQKSALLEQQKQLDAENRRNWEAMLAKQEARQRQLDQERELDRRNLAYLNDQKLAADAKAKLDQKQKELEDERRAAAEQRARADADLKREMEALKRQLDNANQKTTTIISQPPPAYPWFYGRYYHPWW